MIQDFPEARRGLTLSVAASALFALMSVYAKLLAPLTGLDIFAWRIVWTLPGALALVAMRGRFGELLGFVRRLFGERRIALMVLGGTAMLGLQLWLFLWAPLHGRMLEVSLGYFLLPLTMVLVGRFVYRESLSLLQWCAIAFAALGVLHEVWATRAFAWPTLLVALGYPPYFMLRRRIDIEPLTLFAVEMIALLPVALLTLATVGTPLAGHTLLAAVLLPGLGVLSTLALGCYLKASRMLPMALFGILGYVEPVLIVAVAVLLLGESLSAQQLGTYGPIWVAVALTAWHSYLVMRRVRAH
ncbi:EamA family transporter RarD [Burkholderia gladioli]|uniref:EamA family transporter RarD n=1 Tax=Burkholderia gladioli TaxID=28095 RepID=UPI000649DBF5|nr:EamA family transporter RarD [Burkholderia gladioli]MDA0575156.1 EamA family transporter RarD [Burkholderia gladioli]MDA0603395.1 EamA family transporter RarD [Burkholderia gladioli]